LEGYTGRGRNSRLEAHQKANSGEIDSKETVVLPGEQPRSIDTSRLADSQETRANYENRRLHEEQGPEH